MANDQRFARTLKHLELDPTEAVASLLRAACFRNACSRRISAMFSSVLIANRGEIACRIIRTARRHGAAHHRGLFRGRCRRAHVALADEAHRDRARAGARELSARSTRSSRPRSARGADCIHPGYGFLSENARFRRGLRDGRHRLRRAAAGGDPRHGPQGRRQGADGEGRRAGRARLSRRRARTPDSCARRPTRSAIRC